MIAIFSLFVLASCQQALAQSCSGFIVFNRFPDPTYTSIRDHGQIISKDVDCPPEHNCTVPYGGYITGGRTMNISNQSFADSVFDTISSVVNLEFTETETYPVAMGTQTVANGTSAYILYTPYTICTTGRLSDCGTNYELNGETVEACTFDLDSDGGITGKINALIVAGQTAAGLTCNPSNTTQAKEGQYYGTCPDGQVQDGKEPTSAASAVG
ncbi:unnamed protein product [Aureobasidium vineae]|uniref:Uncharacterized protein n=1 Tax=Aureobasidium vineae TaxID=2773715 RepID=A0A9N8P6Z1_9PEZI|nr:unnamed protein product [Aureobasidium vineae]